MAGRFRRLGLVLAILALLLLAGAVAGGLLWLARSPDALRWAANRIESALGGRLRLHGLSGFAGAPVLDRARDLRAGRRAHRAAGHRDRVEPARAALARGRHLLARYPSRGRRASCRAATRSCCPPRSPCRSTSAPTRSTSMRSRFASGPRRRYFPRRDARRIAAVAPGTKWRRWASARPGARCPARCAWGRTPDFPLDGETSPGPWRTCRSTGALDATRGRLARADRVAGERASAPPRGAGTRAPAPVRGREDRGDAGALEVRRPRQAVRRRARHRDRRRWRSSSRPGTTAHGPLRARERGARHAVRGPDSAGRGDGTFRVADRAFEIRSWTPTSAAQAARAGSCNSLGRRGPRPRRRAPRPRRTATSSSRRPRSTAASTPGSRASDAAHDGDARAARPPASRSRPRDRANEVEVTRLAVNHRGGRLDGRGRIRLDGPQAFARTCASTASTRPVFADAPSARLTGSTRFEGHSRPRGAAAAASNCGTAACGPLPLSGNGSITRGRAPGRDARHDAAHRRQRAASRRRVRRAGRRPRVPAGRAAAVGHRSAARRAAQAEGTVSGRVTQPAFASRLRARSSPSRTTAPPRRARRGNVHPWTRSGLQSCRHAANASRCPTR